MAAMAMFRQLLQNDPPKVAVNPFRRFPSLERAGVAVPTGRSDRNFVVLIATLEGFGGDYCLMELKADASKGGQFDKVFQANKEHLINGLSGLIAGACGIFVGHPFDTIKIRLQVGDLKKEATARAKSVRELYRGIIPPLCTAGMTQFMVFTIYEHTKLQLMANEELSSSSAMDHLSATFAAATVAGAITSYITSPIQLIKVQQQSAPTALSLRQCVKNVVNYHGIRGLFHGSVPVLFVEGIGRGVYMLTYEYLKATISGGSESKDVTVTTRAISASGAGAFSWFVMYPLDSIKSRRLSDLSSKSSYECYQQTMKAGGVRAFYRGCAFAMLRSVPVAATILPLYEYCREKLAAVI